MHNKIIDLLTRMCLLICVLVIASVPKRGIQDGDLIMALISAAGFLGFPLFKD
jgi:hypothetical protein